MAHSVNDNPLVSMEKDTDGPLVWSDEPWNKHDPDYIANKNLI